MEQSVITTIKNLLPERVVHFLGQWYIILKNPVVGTGFFLNDIRQDYLALTGKVSYPHHIILIIGIPKSGTSWIEQLLNQLPGFVQANNSVIRSFTGKRLLPHLHDINDAMFYGCPKKRYSFLKLHTHYSLENIATIERVGVRPIIIIRDLRDMMISRYYHTMSDPGHWMYSTIGHLTPEQGFLRSLYDIDELEGIDPIDYFAQWIDDWISYSKAHPEAVLIIKYEEMKHDVHATLKRLLAFTDINIGNEAVAQIVTDQEKTYRDINRGNLTQKLKQRGRLRSTFRKGQAGGWKSFFTEEHKEAFKKRAGNTLITSGYEKDLSW
jgi:sulfotransferase 6B1